jgi:hypothetical protein
VPLENWGESLLRDREMGLVVWAGRRATRSLRAKVSPGRWRVLDIRDDDDDGKDDDGVNMCNGVYPL